MATKTKTKTKKTRAKRTKVKAQAKIEVPEIPVLTPELAQTTPVLVRQKEFLAELGTIPGSYQQWLSRLKPGQQLRIRNRVNRMKHGLHAVAPLTCVGPGGCPFFSACPIPDDIDKPGPFEDYPAGQPCVLEGEYMIQKVGEYFVHLDVDPSNPIERSIVQELALIDLQKNRALLIMSNGDKDGMGRDFLHVDESIIGYDEQGGELVSKTTKIHPVIEYLDKLENRRTKWLDKLMETRKAKADWAAKMGNNQADSKILTEISEMRKVVSQMLTAQAPLALTAADDDEEPLGLDD